ncbi:MAG: hypothetical protein ACYDHM_13885 [Acidiferrobacterales bacterium]
MWIVRISGHDETESAVTHPERWVYQADSLKSPCFTVLASLFLAACAVGNRFSGIPTAAQAQQVAAIRQRERKNWVYTRQANKIIGHSIRGVRVAEEQRAMDKAGHPVPPSTGWCSAVVTVDADGSIRQIRINGCASDSLGKVELKAIRKSAPFRRWRRH